jgi:hypothetical protein
MTWVIGPSMSIFRRSCPATIFGGSVSPGAGEGGAVQARPAASWNARLLISCPAAAYCRRR